MERKTDRNCRISEPHPYTGLHVPHGIRRVRKSKLRAGYHGVPARERDVVQGIRRIDSKVSAQTIADTKGPPERRVQGELRRTRDRIASRVAPFTRGGGD